MSQAVKKDSEDKHSEISDAVDKVRALLSSQEPKHHI